MPHFPKITPFKYNCTHARVYNWHLIYKHMVNHLECLEGWFHLTFGISSFGYLTLHVKATEYSAIWCLWRGTMTQGPKVVDCNAAQTHSLSWHYLFPMQR